MNRIWTAAIVLLVLVGLVVVGLRFGGGPAAGTVASPPPTAAPAPTARPTLTATPVPKVGATVVSVIDGDTIRARLGGSEELVRILGMDSPETHKPDTPVECFGTEATDAAKRLLPKGSRVTLQADPTQATRDRFGRLLAHVFLADGTLFAERMIRDGFAVHYVYDRVPSIYADRLSAAQDAAKAAGAGLWSPRTCGGDPHAPSAPPA